MILVDIPYGTVHIVEEVDDFVQVFDQKLNLLAEGDTIRIAEGKIFCIKDDDSVWQAELA